MKPVILQVALDTPLEGLFDYACPVDQDVPPVGSLVLIPFGRREVAGIVAAIIGESQLAPDKIKTILAWRRELGPLSERWLSLCAFAAEYYHRPLGEVALPALPKQLRGPKPEPLLKALRKLAPEQAGPRRRKAAKVNPDAAQAETPPARSFGHSGPISDDAATPPSLNEEQAVAVAHITGQPGFAPILLFGVTGSGKTEVYLHAAAEILARSPDAQVLMLVPEINLTPQLLSHVQARFPDQPIATMHSGLAEGERLLNWLAAHTGRARIIIGTRLAVLASLPGLAMIIVDEEHDASYKQQEGLRYSARDLAVWRAHQLQIPIVLGSATPSLESWQHAESGRYQKLALAQRAVQNAALPKVGLVDLERDKPKQGLSDALLSALKKRLESGEQSLLFLNRRGYAPVLNCESCGWVSSCKRCTAFMVLHKPEQRLRCHHCSLEMRIPRSCPTCGNIDLQPMGRGTQRVEEGLQAVFPEARILRIDADSTRRKGAAQAAFESVHSGQVDILVGTQMVAKGHDFKNLTLVGVLNPDTALFSHDYRASERLFAQLMQVSGRAGRAEGKEGGNPAQVLVQTRYPQHPLYATLAAHDYPGFAAVTLAERAQAGLPPFVHQALLRAEAKTLEAALEFLQAAINAADDRPPSVMLNDPIPMTISRVADLERAQMLVESSSRPALQSFLRAWVHQLRHTKSRVRWSLEVDPMEI
ncbi:primosomal protein N' [Lacisediminimonas profundi]|uniref:primosomal protein N' n=1 Tax=Lacisediminimonas profundi TaxID=2603856 RepID=UPI00124BC4BA|nr:primosomal protein N' [Lacisediminimonas profundi]